MATGLASTRHQNAWRTRGDRMRSNRTTARTIAASTASGMVTHPEPSWVTTFATSVSQAACRSRATLYAVWSPGVGPGSPTTTDQ